jgi:hypothetical protein
MGYFLTGREEHAAQAKKLLRAWFLHPAPTGAEERYRGGDF